MELIADTVDLSAYLDAPNFKALVRSASEFADQVKADLDPNAPAETAPGLSIQNARGLIHFRPGEVSVWSGYNGHRKSMFTSQAAIDLAAQGERVLIVSLEMLPWRTMSRMARQACGEAHPSAGLIDRFHAWTDGRLWLFDHVGRIAPDRALALCRYFAEVHKGTHVFLDSWMMICASEEALDEQKAFSTDLCRLAQETGLHVHVVAHCKKPGGMSSEAKPPGRYDVRGSGAISDQASNVFSVWMNKSKFERLDANPGDLEAQAEPCGMLKCDKQRNGSWEGSIKLWHDAASLRFCDNRTSRVEPYRFLTRGHQ
nr:AAA family ATPase [uncultured Albidiferax sp.]